MISAITKPHQLKSGKEVRIFLPEKLKIEVKKYINNGWFNNENELILFALRDFINHNSVNLTDHFMAQDIQWSLKLKRRKRE